MTNHPFPTFKREIALKAAYPIIMGEKDQPSSKLDASGLSQQFIDRRLQKEIVLSRSTLGQDSSGAWAFGWTLTFYTHPGMRREIPVRPRDLETLADYIHALAVGVAPMDRLDQRLADWCVFHTFGFGGLFVDSSDVLRYLKENAFPWATVAPNVGPYGIQTYPMPVKAEV
jgi:hypothetical protein